MTLQQLQEKRNEIVTAILGFRDKLTKSPTDWSGEDEEKFDRANDELAAVDRQMRVEQIAERAQKNPLEAEVEAARLDASARARHEPEEETRAPESAGVEDRALALQGWMLGHAEGAGTINERQRQAMRRCGVTQFSREFSIPLLRGSYRQIRTGLMDPRAEQRDLLTSTQGEIIAPDFVRNLERSLLEFGGMREVAEVLRTETGAALTWPTVDTTAQVGQIEGEGDAFATQDVTFGELTLNSYKYSSDAVLVSYELLQDSAFNLATVISDIIGERLGRKTNTDFTLGTGTAQPKGIVTAAGTVDTAASGTLAADDVITLIHSVGRAYRRRATFMMSDAIAKAVRLLKLSDGQYLWQPGFQQGQPDSLLGYNVVINDDMETATAAGDKVMLFGDLSKYKIREVGAIRFRHLVERYAEQDKEAFVAYWRGDGDLLDAGVDPLKCLVIAT